MFEIRIAKEMAEEIELDLDEYGHISSECYDLLQTMFELIPPSDRGDVFINLLNELDSRGLEYDKSIFQMEDE